MDIDQSKMKSKNNTESLFYFSLSFLFVLIAWSIASKIINNSFLFPSILDILKNIIQILNSKNFITITLSTINRVMISFIISLILAIVLGVLSAISKPVQKFLLPIVNIIKAIPTMSVILISIMLISITKAPLLVCIMVVFPILFTNIFHGIKSIDKKLLDMAKIYKISLKDRIINIYIPSIRNYIYAAVKSTFGLSIKVMVASEILGQVPFSIGNELMTGKIYLNISLVLAWTVIVIIISLLSDLIIDLLFKYTNKETRRKIARGY